MGRWKWRPFRSSSSACEGESLRRDSDTFTAESTGLRISGPTTTLRYLVTVILIFIGGVVLILALTCIDHPLWKLLGRLVMSR